MKHSVRSTLATLGFGVLAQRLLQLATFWCLGQALGVDRLGRYAEGLALGALLAVLAGAGVRNVLARAIARQPQAAGALLRTAVTARLRTGITLLVPALAITFAVADQPWFYCLCLLQVLPAAFDLKNLLDASGRTGREVLLETGTAALQFVAVGGWLATGGRDLVPLAAIALGCRCLYAAGALPTIARLPRAGAVLAAPPSLRGTFAVSLGQTAHELLAAGDVWLVARLFGPEAAGLYALAVRLATAALVPSGQLARLLLPHLLVASAAGDPRRTARTALRATAFATLPMVGGGLVVAEPLCALFGPGFAAAAPALRLVLLAGCLQHLGWQCSHALFAAGRDRAYAAGLWWPAVLHALLLGAFAARADAGSAALAMLLAQTAYLLNGLCGLRATFASAPGQLWLGPLLVGGTTAATAAIPLVLLPANLALGAALATGGAGCLLSLWAVELRGRLRALGNGLASASGLHG